jgi:tetratricopeptide (TPR) repeat protein
VAADPADDDAWVYRWTWVSEHEGAELADRLIAAEREATGDRSIRWRWADSVRAMERHRAHPALAAATLAEHASVLDQNHRQHWATWQVKGFEAEVNGRLSEALGSYGRSIARGPALPSVVSRAVRRLLAARQIPDATGLLAQVKRQRFPLLEDRMLLAETMLAQQQNEGTLALVREIAKSMPAEKSNIGADRLVWLTGMLFQLGQVHEADDCLARLVQDYPGDLRTWLVHQSLRRTATGQNNAIDTLQEIEKLPPSGQRDFLVAEIKLTAGQVEQADDLFRRSWKEGTLSESEWRTLIDVLRWRKDANLEPVVERARQRFPAASWLELKPSS